MPNYTTISKESREEYYSKLINLDRSSISSLAEEDPVIFGKYFLGKKVRLHQAHIMKKLLECIEKGNVWLAMCLARQLGKSIGLAIFLIWAAWYNKIPKTILKITAIYIISRDDDVAEELLDKIRGILHDGDKEMFQYTGQQDFFTGSLKEPNNMHQITFLNGCFIKSIAPTGKVLGKSSSIVVIDEAHRLKCEDPDKFYNQFVVPTTAETGGLIILSSSPEGIVGFFYDAMDPEHKNPKSKYETIWFPYYIWDDGTPECIKYHAFVQSEKERLGASGRIKEWEQEYLALFTVTQSSFFDLKDMEESLDNTPQRYEWKETPCSLGIDYGMKVSRTVLTIRTMIKDKIVQLFQYRCPANFDINNLVNPDWEHSIQQLRNRYTLFMIIPDDCPQGDSTNRWLELNSGIQVKKYNFRSDQMSKSDGVNRNCAAYSYRAKLKEGILKIPTWNTIQQFEMKTVQEIEQKVLISIKSPTGHLCDTFDSDMMACIPFLDMSTNYDFEVDSLSEPEDKDKFKIECNRQFFDKDMPKQLSDEEMKDIIKNKNYDRLVY